MDSPTSVRGPFWEVHCRWCDRSRHFTSQVDAMKYEREHLRRYHPEVIGKEPARPSGR